MGKAEFERSVTFDINEILEYVAHSIVIKTIMRKTTGNISAISVDSGEVLTGKTSPFDTFIHIIEGKAEIIIADESNFLERGQSIIIPAHARNTAKANECFKMLSLTIKSGYEELI